MIGEVGRTGPVEMTPDMTLSEAHRQRGRLSEFAKKRTFCATRAGRPEIPVHYKEALGKPRVLTSRCSPATRCCSIRPTMKAFIAIMTILGLVAARGGGAPEATSRQARHQRNPFYSARYVQVANFNGARAQLERFRIRLLDDQRAASTSVSSRPGDSCHSRHRLQRRPYESLSLSQGFADSMRLQLGDFVGYHKGCLR